MIDNIVPLENNFIDETSVKTILIFGISSFVGSNIADFLKDEFRVVGTYNVSPVTIPGVITIPCDVLNKESVQLAISVFRPDVTIYSVGLSSITECDKTPALADALNANGLFNVVESCQRYKSQICYLSSNFVFNGQNKNYIEMDIPDSSTVYGRSQASAEFYIQKTSLNYIIFRCCKLYGRSFSYGRRNWFETLENYLVKNEGLNVDNFIRTGFLDIIYLCMILKIIIKRDVKNRLLQVNTKNIMSHYEFSKLYAKNFGFSSSVINKGMWEFPLMNTFDDSSQVQEKFFQMDILNVESFLKITLPTIEESLSFTYRRLNEGEIKYSKKGGGSSKGIQFI